MRDGSIEVFRQPLAAERRYASFHVARGSEAVALLAFPDVTIAPVDVTGVAQPATER